MTTHKRATIHLNKREAEMLKKLREKFEDSQSAILRSALIYYYYAMLKGTENGNNN